LREPLVNAVVEVQVDGRAFRFAGDVEPDAVTYVGTVEIGDAIDVEVALDHPICGRVTNRYPLLVLDACR
jgi:hypothetical protein